MARYRKVDIRMWGDEKFRSLSRPSPNGQFLWIYLLTGPHTNGLPGVFDTGAASLSEALNWPVTSLKRCLAPILARRMAVYDERHHLFWIPNAIRYNLPSSPNVIRSWSKTWDELPECLLKARAREGLRKGIAEALGEAFVRAFDEACPKAFGESGTGTGTGERTPPLTPPVPGGEAFDLPPGLEDEDLEPGTDERQGKGASARRLESARLYAIHVGFHPSRRDLREMRGWVRAGRTLPEIQRELDRCKSEGEPIVPRRMRL
jgi:hypothetical protein